MAHTPYIDIEHYHAAITQAAEKKKMLEENKEQGQGQGQGQAAQSSLPKDDNAHARPTQGNANLSQPQKNGQPDADKPAVLQVDEIEVDEVIRQCVTFVCLYLSFRPRWQACRMRNMTLIYMARMMTMTKNE
jgi:hypothetical protein